MRKTIFFYIMLLVIISVSFSCSQKKEQPAQPPKHIIQDTFFGTKLGKSDFNEVIQILKENKYRGKTIQDEDGSINTTIITPIFFGGVNWEYTGFRFTQNGILVSVTFFIPENSRYYDNNMKESIFSKLQNDLSKKYYLEFTPANDSNDQVHGTYVGKDHYNEVDLIYDGGLYLGYGVLNVESIEKSNSDL